MHTHIGNREAIVGRCGSGGGENRPHSVPVRIRAHLKFAQLMIKSVKLLSKIGLIRVGNHLVVQRDQLCLVFIKNRPTRQNGKVLN